MKKRNEKALQVGDRPHYRLWQGLYLAFYSSDLYIDVAKRWRGWGMLYLLLLVACATAPLSMRVVVRLNEYINEQFIEPIRVLPPLFIHQGVVSFDNPMPYYIKNKKGDVVGIVDTTGHVNGLNAHDYPMLTWVVTKDKLYLHSPPFHVLSRTSSDPVDGKVYVDSLDTQEDGVFVGEKWLESTHLQAMKGVVLSLIYPCFVSFVFMFILSLSFGLAWLGQFFARVMFHVQLPYLASLRVLHVALTAPLVICLGLVAADKIIPGTGLYYLALLALYFSFAVMMLKRSNQVMVLA